MALGKMNKKILSFLAILLCTVMIMALLPSIFLNVEAADYYYNTLVEYQFNSKNKGYYFVPKAPGKYPVIIMVHGQGGMANMKPHMLAFMNDWVKAGYFEPAVVVLPQIDNYDGLHSNARDIIDFQQFVDQPERLQLLLTNIKNGTLTAKADGTRPISIAGYSMGGYCSIYAASKFHELLKVGCISPSASFYLGEGKWGSYNYAADIHMSTDPDAKILLICGAGEADSATYNGYEQSIDRYIEAINVNNTNPNLMTKYLCPADWNGHGWYLFQREIFMWMYLNKNGVLPSESQVVSACTYRMPPTPEVAQQEKTLDNVTLPSKLVNLNISGFTKNTSTNPSTATGSIGGITNGGSRGTSTRVVMSGYDTSNSQNIELKAFETNSGSTTNYLHYSKNSTLVQTNNNSRFVEDSALETQGNTITFWAKISPQQERRSIFNYRVSYGSTPSSSLRLCTQSSTSTLTLCNGWDSNVNVNMNDTNGKWAQYAITNPAYSDGSKTMSVYVNGSLMFEKTIEKPSGTLDFARLYFAGENEGNHTIFYPDEFDLSGITVYNGVLSQDQIYKANEVEAPLYEVKGEASPVVTPDDPQDPDPQDPDPQTSEVTVPYYPAFSSDPYSKQIVYYSLNSECTGYYMTPKTAGKYRTFIMMHGSGGVGTLKTNLWTPINKWVKEGYFPPMVVVIPEIQDYTGSGLNIDDFQYYINSAHSKRFNTLLNNVLNGALTSQIDTNKPLYVGGFSMGGMAAVYAGDEFRTKLKNVGGLSPSQSYYLGDGQWGFRNYATDIHFSSDSDALVYLSCGLGEGSGVNDTLDRYETAIKVNNGNNLVKKYKAPSSWGGHRWPLCEKEIFMYLYYNIYGELPEESLVEAATANISYSAPTVVQTEETHTGSYTEPEGPTINPQPTVPEDIKGYSFSNSTVTYDGQKHMINVTAGSNATQGVSIAYTVNGSAFTGATEVGTYPVTATLTKSGYNNLVLNATLIIKSASTDPGNDGDLLVDLDFSTYQKDTTTAPAGITTSIGNVTDTGSLAASTKVVMSSVPRYHQNSLDQESFLNADGTETYYVHETHNDGTVQDINRFRYVEQSALETQSNTISFWLKYNPATASEGGAARSILDYVVTNDDGATSTHILQLFSDTSNENKFMLRDSGYTMAKNITGTYGEDAWINIVITNPVYENGKKTMTLYVNGTACGSKEVTQPEGTFSQTRLAFAGPSPMTYYKWPKDISFGDIEVYSGAMSASDIAALYAENANRYVEAGSAPVVEDITGYTFSNASVEYDGQNHMISVAAASGATQGVDIAYTCNGSAFTGATEVGTYPVKATITKAGYNNLVLNATLTITSAQVTPPDPIDEGELLIDLDMSTYVKDDSATDPNNVEGSIGSIVNSGALASSTIVKMSSQSGRWTNLDLTKETFENAEGGTTAYLHRTITEQVCSDVNRHNIVVEKALEEQANTITFWANYTPVNRESVEYTLLDYNVTYSGEASHLINLEQAPTTTGKFNLVDRGQSAAFGNITDKAAGKWAQYVITNPAYENGTKTMKIYVNGECLGEKTVTQPTGTVEVAKLCFGGEAAPTKAGYYWPTDLSLGEIKVYSGVMSADDIAAAYNDSKTRYTAAGTPALQDITGYTFEDASYEFDAATHNILVSAAIGATEDVDIAYTCNGSAFTGASEVGTYNVTATITKAGYNDLVLNATLTIEPAQSQPIDDGDILVELDLTDFAESNEEGSSGIVNTGTSTTAVINAYSSDAVALTTDYIYDKDDLSAGKKVIRLTHSDLDTVLSAKRLDKHFELSDPAFEDQDITLSFWTNLDPISKQNGNSAFTSIVQYNAKRDDGTYRNQADGTSSRARLWQYSLDTSPYYYWGNAWGYEIAMNNSKQWHHVVMTIPKFQNGAKTVNIYVDGTLGLTQEVNLGGHELAESFISFGSDENKAYVSTDISFSDIKVYAGAMSEEGIENLYESEKDSYDNLGYTKLGATKDGSAINKLSDLEAGDTITISYAENVTDGTRIFAACYDEDGMLLSANTAEADGEGSFELDIPEGFASVKIYTWNGLTLAPIQKATTLLK